MKNDATAHASSKIRVRTVKYSFYYLAMLFRYQTFGDACFINFTYLHDFWGDTMDIKNFTVRMLKFYSHRILVSAFSTKHAV